MCIYLWIPLHNILSMHQRRFVPNFLLALHLTQFGQNKNLEARTTSKTQRVIVMISNAYLILIQFLPNVFTLFIDFHFFVYFLLMNFQSIKSFLLNVTGLLKITKTRFYILKIVEEYFQHHHNKYIYYHY